MPPISVQFRASSSLHSDGTHVGSLPLEGEWRRLVVEDGGLRRREVGVLPQLPLLQALLAQLLEAPNGRHRHRGLTALLSLPPHRNTVLTSHDDNRVAPDTCIRLGALTRCLLARLFAECALWSASLLRGIAGIALACAVPDGRIAGWIWARGTLLPLYCYYPVAALGALDRLTHRSHRRSGSPASCCMVGRTLLD